MIDIKTIRQLAIKWQTTELNVAREYCQHLFLSYFYQQQGSEMMIFKGGTALRLVFGSPRFSEDLDFSCSVKDIHKIEALIQDTLSQIEILGIKLDLKEAKKTTGGYLAIIVFLVAGKTIEIKLEVSLRKNQLNGGTVIVSSQFIPAYTVEILRDQELIHEKIQALLERQKARDYYDLYFILRAGLLSAKVKKTIQENRVGINSVKIDFSKELKEFLPQSHWRIIKNFSSTLNQELNRQIGNV